MIGVELEPCRGFKGLELGERIKRDFQLMLMMLAGSFAKSVQ